MNGSQEWQRWKGFLSVFHTPQPETGQTPRYAVWKKNKATLWHYPPAQKKYKTPLFLIYSMVNQPFILDLAPGSSVIESFLDEGYDVYLIDFGIPGYEDKDLTMNDYVTDYIQKGVKRALQHSNAEAVTLIGYCLGGTLAAMYASIADEPIRNIVLTVAPFEFSTYPIFTNWIKAIQEGKVDTDLLLDRIGLIPGPLVEAGVRTITSPVYFSPYLSLLNRAYDENYVERWRRFNQWTKGHIPFPSGALKQLVNDLVSDNKLFTGGIFLNGKEANLNNVTQNLLVIASKYDRLVPEAMVYPVMNHVASKDKTYIALEGGHAGISLKGGMPAYLKEWLDERSNQMDE